MPPLPKPPGERRRRNTTGVKPDHLLPTDGRVGPLPHCPIKLGEVGHEVWRWLWSTPQATKWHIDAARLPLARLAMHYEELINETEDRQYRANLSKLIEGIEDRWGLSPKAMTTMHWFFDDSDPATPALKAVPVADIRDRLKGIGDT
jgi:hypothetical protein